MAKQKTPPGAAAAPAAPDPLASPAGRAWLMSELASAEHEVAHGPGGSGWTHNEALRPAVRERAAFLRALAALLPEPS